MRAIVEYVGTGYAGFQRQAVLPSVQGAIEEAIHGATGEASTITAAGRTDAGAHARGQVISFVTDTRLDDETLLRAINAHLPNDVALQSLDTVADSFDPRRQAIRREYHYVVVNRSAPAPLWHGRGYWTAAPLDLDLMRAGGSRLVGIHDFASFGSPSSVGGYTIREIFELNVIRESDLVRFEVIGSGFLQHMVRSMVGTLLDVGRGRIGPEYVQEILDSRDRSKAAPPVPADGLYLINVDYAPDRLPQGISQ